MSKPKTKRPSGELPLADLLNPPTSVEIETHAAVLSQNHLLRRRVKELQEKLGNRTEMIQAVQEAARACPPVRAVRWHIPKKRTIELVPVLMLSDWHIGELIDADQTEGFGSFNWEIAQAGMDGIVTDYLRWIEALRQRYVINNLALFTLGDWVSGDIHHELQVTNEFTLPEQTANAGYLLTNVIRRLTGHFRRVDIWDSGAGNHDRLVKKPQFKQRAENSVSFMVLALAQQGCARETRVTWHTTKGIKQVAQVNGIRFLIEHGDCVKNNFGTPYYGFSRAVGREAVKRLLRRRWNDSLSQESLQRQADQTFRYWAIGHWHVPAVIENSTLVNGSLSGTTEYDSGLGRIAEPCQVGFTVNKRRGIGNWTPFARET